MNAEINTESKDWERVEGGDVFTFEKGGDSVEGKLIKIRDGQYNNKVYDIECDDVMHVVFGTTVLDGRISEKHIGQPIRIVYLGEKTSKKGRVYDDFDIFTKKESQESKDAEAFIPKQDG